MTKTKPSAMVKADAAVITRRGAASMAAASVVSGASGYVVLAIVAHRISPAANADFLVFWSLLFGALAVLGGLQQEATRAVGAAAVVGSGSGAERGARVLPWSVLLGSCFAALLAALAPWWRSQMLSSQGAVVAAVLCLAAVVYSGHFALIGNLAGLRLWSHSAVVIAGEATLRVVLVAVAAALGTGLIGLESAVTASTPFWIAAIALSPVLRRAAAARGDVPVRRLALGSVQAMVAAVGSAALVVGFPTLLRLTSEAPEWTGAAPLVLAVSLTRAPLVLPLSAFQGVAISYFLESGRNRAAALVRIMAVIASVGVLGAVLATAVGPWLMATFFGAAYRVPGPVLGALTLAAIALAVLTMTGAAVLALGRHRTYVAGWLVAAALSVGLLFVPLSLEARCLVALAAGPLAGVGVHLLGIRGCVVAKSVTEQTSRG